MPVEECADGDGITKRRGTEISAPFGPSENNALREMLPPGKDFGINGRLAAIEAQASAILNAAGLPTDGNIPGPTDGGPDTLERYANDAINLIGFIRAGLKGGDAEMAALFALRLGALLQAAELKTDWERHALRGEKVVDSARQGGRNRGVSSTDRNAEIVARFKKLRSEKPRRISNTSIAKDLAPAYGLTFRRVLQIVSESIF